MDNYRTQMPIDSFIAVKDLENMIREIVKQEIKHAQFDNRFPATVSSTPSGGYANVTTPSGVVYNNIKVQPYLTLNIGDTVYITKINGSSNNLTIEIKK